MQLHFLVVVVVVVVVFVVVLVVLFTAVSNHCEFVRRSFIAVSLRFLKQIP